MRAQQNGASLAAAFDGRLEAAVAALHEKVQQLESELAGCDFHCICIFVQATQDEAMHVGPRAPDLLRSGNPFGDGSFSVDQEVR